MASNPNPATINQQQRKQQRQESVTLAQCAVNHRLQQQAGEHQYLAYALQALACIFWPLSFIYPNQHNFSTCETMLAKSIIGFFLSYLLLLYTSPSPSSLTQSSSPHRSSSPRIFRWLLVFNLCILPYFYYFPYSQLYLPLPVVHTIGTSSIAISYLMDYLLNGARVNRWGLAGVALAVLGVGLMANNRLILWLWADDAEGSGDGPGFESSFGNYRDSSILYGVVVAVVLFGTRIAYTYAMVSIKKFPEISTPELNFHNNLMGIFTGALGYMLQPPQTHTPIAEYWPGYVSVGLGQFVSTTLFFYSFKLTSKTGNVMIINAMNIIVAFIISYCRYGEAINPVLGLGAASIIASMGIVVFEGRDPKAGTQTQTQVQAKVETKAETQDRTSHRQEKRRKGEGSDTNKF